MFDFFREVQTQDTVYFYGITDHKENKLLARLKKDIKNHKAPLAPDAKASRLLKQLHQLTFLLQRENINTIQPWSVLNPPTNAETPVFRPHRPETPPPKHEYDIQAVVSA